MNLVRGVVALLFLAAVVAAGVVVTHSGGKVDQAGAEVGYTPPAPGQRVLVLGDSFSISPDGGQDNWIKLLTDADSMKADVKVTAGSGYLGRPSFYSRLTSLKKASSSESAAATQSTNVNSSSGSEVLPDWIIIWDAHDDFANVADLKKAKFGQLRNKLAVHMQKTLTLAKLLVPAGRLIVVGPADGPQIPERRASALDGIELAVATQVGVHYISPVANHWFTLDPKTNQDNGGFISINNTPTNDGQIHIAAEMQTALANIKGNTQFGQLGQQVTDPVPPVLPTVVPTPVTKVSVSTMVHTSVTPITRTVSEPPVTVAPPPVVVTVTVPATR